MIDQHIRSMLGPSGVIGTDARGSPRVAPRSPDECALILSAASSEGWRVRVEGNGKWNPTDAPADLALTTQRITGVMDFTPTDLVATTHAGTAWSELRGELADEGVWVPIDPPGVNRSVGSVIATGTSGPLRTGFGTVRDHVLGLTLVTGDGRVIRVGGKVVKNVAGFDIAKLATGSFGAFGVITSVNFRLRAVPRADLTLFTTGPRDDLLRTAHAVLDAGLTPGALEVLAPRAAQRSEWVLAARLVGTDASVRAEHEMISAAIAPLVFQELDGTEAGRFWQFVVEGAVQAPITLRLGALSTSLSEALDIVAHHLDETCEDWLTVSTLSGTVRWSGNATYDRLRLLRHAAAQQEMPVTLERAPWEIRTQLAHFGAYSEEVGRLIASLRGTFDPNRVILVPTNDRS